MATSSRLVLGMLVTSIACLAMARADEVYVAPKLFEGVLIVSTCDELSPQQSELLAAEFQSQPAPGRLFILANNQAETGGSLKELQKLKWTAEPQRIAVADEAGSQLNSLTRGDCVWVHAASLPEKCAPLVDVLKAALDRGVVAFLDASDLPVGQSIDRNQQLLPDMALVRTTADASENSDREKYLFVGVPDDCWLRISGRAIINLSQATSAPCLLRWPATEFYKELREQRVPGGTVADLVTFRRAWYERQQPEFPNATEYRPQLSKGSLVIVGGGRTPAEIWKKFIELAGGKESRIVILPTAVPEPTIADADELQIFERLGAGEVRVLPQIDRDEVSKPEYLDQLRWATGVWFGGGRQWRFVDAYWGTPAWHELKQVTERGGVIGGSSAGATIQGDLLVRGHPLGNQIMVADGYRRGLGLLSGVAIDQHFRQRNRFDDLAGVVARFPTVIGMGIDEGTALVVQATAKCQVLGEGSVWLTTPANRNYTEHASGSEFSLQGR